MLMTNKAKLSRRGFISSLGERFSEPNIGPYPQYNIIVEDEPIEKFVAHASHPKRRYKSGIRSELVRMLEKSKTDLVRLQTVLENPRSKQAGAPLAGLSKWKHALKSPGSLIQDHEQFIEDNESPYQEIHVHPESVVPEGGDAPIKKRPRLAFLNLNRTVEDMELKLLGTVEDALLKKLETIAVKLSSNNR